jgi:hypothetical protein
VLLSRRAVTFTWQATALACAGAQATIAPLLTTTARLIPAIAAFIV